MRARWGLVVLLLVAAACSNGDGGEGTPGPTSPTGGTAATEPTGPSPVVVSSPDGLLEVRVPASAAADLDLTVTQTDEPPPELADVTISGSFYELGPDGTEFDEPVTVTKTIDVASTTVDLAEGIPVVVLLSRSSGGTWEYLADQHQTLEDGVIRVTGTTTHFSTVTALGGVATIGFVPDEIELAVGESFTAVASIRPAFPAVEFAFEDAGASGSVASGDVFSGQPLPAPPLADRFKQPIERVFVCAQEGPGTYHIDVRVENLDLTSLVADTGDGETALELEGVARCVLPGSEGTPPVRVDEGAVCVVHEELDGFPSYLQWLLSLSGFDAEGATLRLTVEGGNGGEPQEAEIALDGSASMEMGITEFGVKPIREATVVLADGTAVDATQAFVDYFGPAPEVTAEQGTIAGQGDCPAF